MSFYYNFCGDNEFGSGCVFTYLGTNLFVSIYLAVFGENFSLTFSESQHKGLISLLLL